MDPDQLSYYADGMIACISDIEEMWREEDCSLRVVKSSSVFVTIFESHGLSKCHLKRCLDFELTIQRTFKDIYLDFALE